MLALDAVVPVVAPSNPVKQISPLTLARVFSGEIKNWQRLGGPDAPIELHLPTADSGLSQAIVDQVLTPAGLELSGDVTRHTMPDALAEAVARDVFALGITSYAEQGGTEVLTLGGNCGFALDAARRTIKTEDYPLTAPMFLYFPVRKCDHHRRHRDPARRAAAHDGDAGADGAADDFFPVRGRLDPA